MRERVPLAAVGGLLDLSQSGRWPALPGLGPRLRLLVPRLVAARAGALEVLRPSLCTCCAR
eukprot:3375955-Pyramimonas_sp.AAC.1